MNHMNLDLRSLSLETVNNARVWIKKLAWETLQNGQPLTPEQLEIARQVEVVAPDKIRLQQLDTVPIPEDPELEKVMREARLLQSNTAGVTLGYAVLIFDPTPSTRLLSHEFRHVQQFERCGSLDAFLALYLTGLQRYGYAAHPMELDARKHELADSW
jgi:hypothetical protein